MNARLMLLLFGLMVASPGFAAPQESSEPQSLHQKHPVLLTPGQALDKIQQDHSDRTPIMVAQDELDQLIDCKGGGACPISAALIGFKPFA